MNNNGFIYFLTDYFIYKNNFCILFDQEPRKIQEKYINLIDEKNGYGTVKMDDIRDREDFLLINNDYEDLK